LRKLILISIASLILTVTIWTLPYFIVGLELLFLPFYLLLFFIGALGVILIPIGFFIILRKKTLYPSIVWVCAVSIGFYIGYLVLKPIDIWDLNEKNRSGEIISQELEIYKNTHGQYPEKLTLLDTVKLENELPFNYKISRFNYNSQADDYDLDIPIPITDRWHWRKQAKQWGYNY